MDITSTSRLPENEGGTSGPELGRRLCESLAIPGVDKGSPSLTSAAPSELLSPRRLLTKRFILAAVSLTIATALCLLGKLGGTEWVYALGVILVGHGTQDVVDRMKK